MSLKKKDFPWIPFSDKFRRPLASAGGSETNGHGARAIPTSDSRGRHDRCPRPVLVGEGDMERAVRDFHLNAAVDFLH